MIFSAGGLGVQFDYGNDEPAAVLQCDSISLPREILRCWSRLPS